MKPDTLAQNPRNLARLENLAATTEAEAPNEGKESEGYTATNDLWKDRDGPEPHVGWNRLPPGAPPARHSSLRRSSSGAEMVETFVDSTV
jgi:hypothetical protein